MTPQAYGTVLDCVQKACNQCKDKDFLEIGLEAKLAENIAKGFETRQYQLPTLSEAEQIFEKTYFGTVLGAGLAHGNKASLAEYSGLGVNTVFRRQQE